MVWKSCCQQAGKFPRARVKHMQTRYAARKVKVHGSVAQHTRERERKLFRSPLSQLDSVKTVKMSKQLVKLSEESRMREPEEVFDLLEKIGEG